MSSTKRDTGSTIEFELNADELLDPSRDHASQRASRSSARSAKGSRAQRLRVLSRGVGLTLSIAAAAFILGLAGERVSMRRKPPPSAPTTLAEVTASVQIPSAFASKPSPVRFANPFDRTEVFEFPPGTSVESAREAVAEILLNRARGRHVRHAHRSRRRPQTESAPRVAHS